MTFGEQVRELRFQRGLTQKELAERLAVSVSYISKVENERLHFGDYPSEKFVHKLAEELQADEDELLLLTDRVPEAIRKRVRERPDLFKRITTLSDQEIESLLLKASK